MQRVRVEIVCRRDLDDAAEIHHRDAVGDVTHDREVVRDEEIGQLEVSLELFEQIDDLRPNRNVERRDRLVADDEVRIHRERARDSDPLSLAARELVRVARRSILRQTDAHEQIAHAPVRVALRREPMHAHRLGDHPTHRVPRIQGRERILEDHLHPPPQRPQVALAERREILPVEGDPPGRRLVQADDRPADRGLAAARFTDEPERLAALDRERDIVDRLDVADVPVEHDPALDREVDLEIGDLDERPRSVRRAHATVASRARAHSSSGTGLKHAT